MNVRKPRMHFANTEDSTMYYLVGMRIPDPFFYVDTGTEELVFLNFLEIDAFKERNERNLRALPIEPFIKKVRAMERDENAAGKLALLICREYGLLEKPLTVARNFPLDVADYLRESGVKIEVQIPFIPERSKKTAKEVSHLRDNLALTHAGFDLIKKILVDSEIDGDQLIYQGIPLSSEYLKEEVEQLMFERGMEDVEGMIISSGSQAAMPHHKGSGLLKANATIVCDLFFRSRANKYFADMTRTYVRGMPSKKALAMYTAVCAAQDAAFAAIRPGVKAADVHAVAADAIAASGFDVGDKGFIHGLGHGLGLELHERPHAGSRSGDVLEIGNVLTVEPGLYYPEWGGVRIEDVVVITKDGFENLTEYPREFELS